MSGKKWTTPEDIRRELARRWDSQKLLRAWIDGSDDYGRISFSAPVGSGRTDIARVREWQQDLEDHGSRGDFTLRWQSCRDRLLGSMTLPCGVNFADMDAVFRFIGKTSSVKKLEDRVVIPTRKRLPALMGWVRKNPLKALDKAGEWHLILDFIEWMLEHPLPAIYLRQLRLEGIHTKFVLHNAAILHEMLESVLPGDDLPAGGKKFEERFGFIPVCGPESYILFRLLDPGQELIPGLPQQTYHLPPESFAALRMDFVDTAFVVENLVTFLAFPSYPRGICIFGQGNKAAGERLAEAYWLNEKKLYYWGDLDAAGFAILDRFRRNFPGAQSFLMDELTLLSNRAFWTTAKATNTGTLTCLTRAEAELCEKLCSGLYGENVQLEQERIPYTQLEEAIIRISCASHPLTDSRGGPGEDDMTST